MQAITIFVLFYCLLINVSGTPVSPGLYRRGLVVNKDGEITATGSNQVIGQMNQRLAKVNVESMAKS